MNAEVVPVDELGAACRDCEPSGVLWTLAADCCPARLGAEPNTRHNSHRPGEERVWTLGVRCLPMRTPCSEEAMPMPPPPVFRQCGNARWTGRSLAANLTWVKWASQRMQTARAASEPDDRTKCDPEVVVSSIIKVRSRRPVRIAAPQDRGLPPVPLPDRLP